MQGIEKKGRQNYQVSEEIQLILTNQSDLFFGIFVAAVLNTSTNADKFWIGLTDLRKLAHVHPVEAKFDGPQAFLFFEQSRTKTRNELLLRY